MTPEETRLAAQGAPTSTASADAYAEREARLGADAASMLAGNAPGHDEQLTYHQGQPSVESQMTSHGAAAPSTPDVGGHDSPSAHIG